MTLSVESFSFRNGEAIPSRYAFGVPTSDGRATAGGGNRSPHLRWSGAPEGTRSFVLTCVDLDVPQDASDAGVPGKWIPAGVPRQDFTHWLLADLPASVSEVAEGAASDGIVPKGKPTGPTPFGGVTGANDFTGLMPGDPEMSGTYGGYDGPFPPWNDEQAHHYRFQVLALDVETLGLPDAFTLADLGEAAAGHVLDSGEWVGTYTLNPNLGAVA